MPINLTGGGVQAGGTQPTPQFFSPIPSTANEGAVSVGPGPWDGTSPGHFAGPAAGTALAINAPGSFSGDLLNVVGSSGLAFRVSPTLVTTPLQVQAGNLSTAQFLTDSTSTKPYLDYTQASAPLIFQTRADAQVPLTAKGFSGTQSADLFDAQSSAGARVFGVGAGGTLFGSVQQPAYAAAMTLTTDGTAPLLFDIATSAVVGNATINASTGGVRGQLMLLRVLNDATAGRTITMGTNFRANNIAGVASKYHTKTLVSDGAAWVEISELGGI